MSEENRELLPDGTLKPWKNFFADLTWMFMPYRTNEKLVFSRLMNDQTYRNQSIWGDLAQPVRGVVNIVKGMGRILRGLAKALLPLPIVGFFLLCYWETKNDRDGYYILEGDTLPRSNAGFARAFVQEGKKLLYDFVNGTGILVHGI